MMDLFGRKARAELEALGRSKLTVEIVGGGTLLDLTFADLHHVAECAGGQAFLFGSGDDPEVFAIWLVGNERLGMTVTAGRP